MDGRTRRRSLDRGSATARVLAGWLGVLAAAGCAGGGQGAADGGSSTAGTAIPGTRDTGSPSSSPLTTTPEPPALTLGEPGPPSPHGTVTVHDVMAEVVGAAAPADDQRWAAADIEVCADSEIEVTTRPWTVLRERSGEPFAPPSEAGPGLPEPGYPLTASTVPGGSCLRGWLPFVVPQNAVIDRVQHAPDGAPATVWAFDS